MSKETPAQELLHTDINRAEPAHLRTLANTYFVEGMKQYNALVVGEEDAKQLFLATLAIGGTDASVGIVFGKPSAGKSRMLGGFERIVDGFEPDEIAKVPHREDLTGAELVGKTSSMEKTTTRDGQQVHESFSSKVKALIHPRTKIIKFDEITRTSPIALNAALELLQDGYITVSNGGDGDIQVSEFDAVFAGMNHYGTLYTHSADPAVVSRVAYGTEMGQYQRGVISPGAKAIWETPGRPYSQRADINPVITRHNLEVIRGAIDQVDISGQMIELGQNSTVVIRDRLEDHGIDMGDPRLASQQKRMAQALSLLRMHTEVMPEDIVHAAQFMLIAKLGVARSKISQGNDELNIPEAVNNILAEIDPIKSS